MAIAIILLCFMNVYLRLWMHIQYICSLVTHCTQTQQLWPTLDLQLYHSQISNVITLLCFMNEYLPRLWWIFKTINKTEPLCTNPYRIQQVYMCVAYPQLAIVSFSTIYHPIHCSRTHTINFVYYRLSKWYTEARWIIGCKKRACPQTI